MNSDNLDSKSSKAAPPTDLLQETIPHDEPAPAYEEPSFSSRSGPSSHTNDTRAHVPTIHSPFDFPTFETAPPIYSNSAPASGSGGGAPKPIAFPQVKPDGKSPFLPAYSPVLLSYGITDATWKSFLDTISAFLTAKVSDRAVSHASDIAQHMGKAPTQFGKSVVSHAKAIGNDIATNAKRGNVMGVVASTIGGAISLPMATAFGAVGTVLALPGSAIGAITKKPRTPLERAATYAAVANEKWFHERGLHAQLYDTNQVAQLIGMSGDQLLETVRATKEGDASRQLGVLQPHIEALEVQEGATLQLERPTLWLVIIPWGK
ncbi:hypothetical protein PT974_06736 [Cladobotryum mycophilum]|uniref:Uncharacterized protein n=1 Tax=Cladobotryum mycophilum TaxID=491253 RepID=A0ABR0SMC0_9HYPO